MLNNLRNYFNFRRPVQLILLVVCISTCFILFTMFDALYLDQILNGESDYTGLGAARCSWEVGDPVLLNLKTKLGVNYEGSHWFHMAENLMVMFDIIIYTHIYTVSAVVIIVLG